MPLSSGLRLGGRGFFICALAFDICHTAWVLPLGEPIGRRKPGRDAAAAREADPGRPPRVRVKLGETPHTYISSRRTP
jgi:hypothetical protein